MAQHSGSSFRAIAASARQVAPQSRLYASLPAKCLASAARAGSRRRAACASSAQRIIPSLRGGRCDGCSRHSLSLQPRFFQRYNAASSHPLAVNYYWLNRGGFSRSGMPARAANSTMHQQLDEC